LPGLDGFPLNQFLGQTEKSSNKLMTAETAVSMGDISGC